MIDNNKAVVKLFEYFYSKVYKTNFKLDLSINNQAKVVNNFINVIGKQYTANTIGVNLLVNYFAFGFAYYSDKILKRKISLNWILGKKLFTKFAERKDGTDYWTAEWLRENNINIDELRSSLVESVEIDYLSLHQSEEVIKGSMADTEARLYNCLMSTTMYNHRSPVCLTCHQKVMCKSLLSKTNSFIFKQRGY